MFVASGPGPLNTAGPRGRGIQLAPTPTAWAGGSRGERGEGGCLAGFWGAFLNSLSQHESQRSNPLLSFTTNGGRSGEDGGGGVLCPSPQGPQNGPGAAGPQVGCSSLFTIDVPNGGGGHVAPLCDTPSGRCSFFTGPWTVTHSSLRMLRRVAAFCRPLQPVLLLLSFPRSRGPVVGVLPAPTSPPQTVETSGKPPPRCAGLQ